MRTATFGCKSHMSSYTLHLIKDILCLLKFNCDFNLHLQYVGKFGIQNILM